jgi:hypothetical protein
MFPGLVEGKETCDEQFFRSFAQFELGMAIVDVALGLWSLQFLVLAKPSGLDRFCHSRRAGNPVGYLVRVLHA